MRVLLFISGWCAAVVAMVAMLVLITIMVVSEGERTRSGSYRGPRSYYGPRHELR